MRWVWMLAVAGCWRSDPEPAKQPIVPAPTPAPAHRSRSIPVPPEPWTLDRIQRELRADPAALLHRLAMGPIVVTDLDAASNQVMCDPAASVAIDQFAPRLGAQPSCWAPQPDWISCMRDLNHTSGTELVFFQHTNDEWKLAQLTSGQKYLVAGARATMTAARSLLVNPVCP